MPPPPPPPFPYFWTSLAPCNYRGIFLMGISYCALKGGRVVWLKREQKSFILFIFYRENMGTLFTTILGEKKPPRFPGAWSPPYKLPDFGIQRRWGGEQEYLFSLGVVIYCRAVLWEKKRRGDGNFRPSSSSSFCPALRYSIFFLRRGDAFPPLFLPPRGNPSSFSHFCDRKKGSSVFTTFFSRR